MHDIVVLIKDTMPFCMHIQTALLSTCCDSYLIRFYCTIHARVSWHTCCRCFWWTGDHDRLSPLRSLWVLWLHFHSMFLMCHNSADVSAVEPNSKGMHPTYFESFLLLQFTYNYSNLIRQFHAVLNEGRQAMHLLVHYCASNDQILQYSIISLC